MDSASLEILKMVAITAGLIVFTYLIYVSSSQKKKVGRGKDKIKRHWRERL
jgi:hypothetical protein